MTHSPPRSRYVRDSDRPRVLRQVPGVAGPRAARAAASRAEDRIPQATAALHALARLGRTCILHGTSALRSRPSECSRLAFGSGSSPAADWSRDAVLPPGRRGLPEVPTPRTDGPGDPGLSDNRVIGLTRVSKPRARSGQKKKCPARRGQTGGAICIRGEPPAGSSRSGAHGAGLDREYAPATRCWASALDFGDRIASTASSAPLRSPAEARAVARRCIASSCVLT